MTAEEALRRAQRHLVRVQKAWHDPTDWSDLALYGFYCLESAVVAAALHLGLRNLATHRGKIDAARRLATEGLSDVAQLLIDLNDARKAEAYGDVPVPPGLDPENVARDIEGFVGEVDSFVGQ